MQKFSVIVADLRAGQKELRAAITSLQDQMNCRFEPVDARFAQMDQRL